MAYSLRDFKGGAPSTTLASDITNASTSISLTSGTGFPSGGASGDFFIGIGSLQSNGTFTNLEVIRLASRSGNTLTVQTSGRGADDTTAVAHTAGETIFHCMTALDAYEANHHIADTALDHHTQYLNTTRHDVTARHTFGAALPTPAAAADISTAAATGSAAGPARADHVHKNGTGAINVATMIAAGTITDTQVNAANKDGASGTASLRTLGTGAAQAAAGNDSRLSDTRTPTDASVTYAKVAANVLTGVALPFAGRTAPTGTLLCDGTAVSRATYANLFAVITPSIGTFTVTIATPAVVTLSSHGLLTGDAVYLTTTGALPTGLSINTLYYVIKVDANSFNLATSRANAYVPTKINTTGSQSGTHTLRLCPYGLGDGSTTFNVPDMRGYVPAGYDAIGGTAASRLTLAQSQGVYANQGATGGEQGHTITTAELAAHSHQETLPQTNSGAVAESNPGAYFGQMVYTNNASHTSGHDGSSLLTSNTGSDTAHNNVQPTILMNYIIYT